MADEKLGIHDAPPVICTVSPHPEKEEKHGNSQVRLRVLGAVTVVTLLVAGLVGALCLTYASLRSTEEDTLDLPQKHYTFADYHKEVSVEFNYHGKSHEEFITVDRYSGVVTYADAESSLYVTLDYGRGVAMIQNTSSSDCFFTRMEYLPQYSTNEKEQLRPIIVEKANETTDEEQSKEDAITLYRSGVIPSEFVQLTTNPGIAAKCVNSTSYWLDGNPLHSRERRQIGYFRRPSPGPWPPVIDPRRGPFQWPFPGGTGPYDPSPPIIFYIR